MNSAGTVSWLEWESNTRFIIADNGGEYAIRNPFLDPLNLDYKSKNFTVQRERWNETMDSTILYNMGIRQKRRSKNSTEFKYGRKTQNFIYRSTGFYIHEIEKSGKETSRAGNMAK